MRGLACLLWLLPTTVQAEVDGDERDDRDERLRASNVYRARELLHWEDSSKIEVYYGEFLLAQWVLDRAPWNAYHSGLAFLNKDTGEKCLYDYSPVDTSSVMKMLMPENHELHGADLHMDCYASI
ncbi:unnamed protein product [Effrenium voratum]|nr:unnamed protein product [Effrenium voratum]